MKHPFVRSWWTKWRAFWAIALFAAQFPTVLSSVSVYGLVGSVFGLAIGSVLVVWVFSVLYGFVMRFLNRHSPEVKANG